MKGIILKKIENEWIAQSYDGSWVEPFLTESQYDPSAERKRLLEYLDLENHHKNIVIVGIKEFELLYQISESLSEYSNLVAIELMESDSLILNTTPEKFTRVTQNKNVTLIMGTYSHVFKQLNAAMFQRKFYYNVAHFSMITTPYIKSTFPKEVSDLFGSAFENIKALMTGFGNSVEDILVGYDNFINNWDTVLSKLHVRPFKNLLPDCPCIIVGAGPSLDKNIRQLKEVQKKAIIISVDAALKRLVDYGIVPDIVATIERTEKSVRFYNTPMPYEKMVFLGPSIIDGEILKKFERIVFTGRQQDVFVNAVTELIGEESIEIGINAAHLPMAFARHMECNPIVFVGLDLAYSEEKTHTGNVGDAEEVQSLYHSDDLVTNIRGQNGENLKTLTFFLYAKKYIEQMIAVDSSRKYVNSTGGGADIFGAENIPLEKVFGELNEIKALKNKVVECYDAHSVLINDTEKTEKTRIVLNYLDEVASQFDNLKLLINDFLIRFSEGLMLFEDISNNLANLEAFRAKNPECSFICQSITIAYNNQFRQCPRVLNTEELSGINQITLKFYQTLIAVADIIMESLNAYKEVLIYYRDRS